MTSFASNFFIIDIHIQFVHSAFAHRRHNTYISGGSHIRSPFEITFPHTLEKDM